MNKENSLFGIVGLLVGLIIGFMFANSVNQKRNSHNFNNSMTENSNIPPGHPEIQGNTPTQDTNGKRSRSASRDRDGKKRTG